MQKKLKLEDLTVTSFDTAPNGPQARGTVDAYAKPVPPESRLGPCYPTDPNFDCTYGCSRDTGCPDQCVMISEFNCI
ncbi:MAG TPA: hypothetical protein VGC13_17210 [Longimicrobium sp.]|jgi:hypothetical protein|uniref:hypothetical protein n=1 Tax=Longimicrobium sp. TaxID=2029185 RepID=UPI002ED9002C